MDNLEIEYRHCCPAGGRLLITSSSWWLWHITTHNNRVCILHSFTVYCITQLLLSLSDTISDESRRFVLVWTNALLEIHKIFVSRQTYLILIWNVLISIWTYRFHTRVYTVKLVYIYIAAEFLSALHHTLRWWSNSKMHTVTSPKQCYLMVQRRRELTDIADPARHWTGIKSWPLQPWHQIHDVKSHRASIIRTVTYSLQQSLYSSWQAGGWENLYSMRIAFSHFKWTSKFSWTTLSYLSLYKVTQDREFSTDVCQ